MWLSWIASPDSTETLSGTLRTSSVRFWEVIVTVSRVLAAGTAEAAADAAAGATGWAWAQAAAAARAAASGNDAAMRSFDMGSLLRLRFSGAAGAPRHLLFVGAPVRKERARQQNGAMPAVIVHLVDGTYELFRHFFGLRRFTKGDDRPLGAAAGVLGSVLEILEQGELHVGVATDHVVESFRNGLWPGYKTGAGIEPALLAQFHPLEEALAAMGVAVWPMVELEADDALASAARIAGDDPAVEKVCIWTPDKDLAQCVRGQRIVQVDRRAKQIRDAEGVRAKFGVEPELIADYLALVGDAGRRLSGHRRHWRRRRRAGCSAGTGPIERFPASVLGDKLEQALLFKAPGDAANRCAAVRRCRRDPLARPDRRLCRLGRACQGAEAAGALPEGRSGLR